MAIEKVLSLFKSNKNLDDLKKINMSKYLGENNMVSIEPATLFEGKFLPSATFYTKDMHKCIIFNMTAHV